MCKKKYMFIILISIVFLSGCELLDKVDEQIEESTSLKITCRTEKQYKSNSGYSYYIEGICTNDSSNDYDYLQVEYICYDKQGNNLGTAMDNTNNLLSGEKWKFKADALIEDVKNIDHCDYHEVNGW